MNDSEPLTDQFFSHGPIYIFELPRSLLTLNDHSLKDSIDKIAPITVCNAHNLYRKGC